MDTDLNNKFNADNNIFGMTVLPEIEIESEYGKLTFTTVSVPMYERETTVYNCILCVEEKLRQIAMKPHSISSFHIMDYFCEELSSFQWGDMKNASQTTESCMDCQEFLEFWYSISVSLRSRLFELGLIRDFGVGHYFGKIPYLNIFSSLFVFNDKKVSNGELFAAGFCLEILHKFNNGLHSNDFLPSTLHYKQMKQIEEQQSIPEKNIMSWSFNQGSKNKDVQNEINDCTLMLFGFFPPKTIILSEEEN